MSNADQVVGERAAAGDAERAAAGAGGNGKGGGERRRFDRVILGRDDRNRRAGAGDGRTQDMGVDAVLYGVARDADADGNSVVLAFAAGKVGGDRSRAVERRDRRMVGGADRHAAMPFGDARYVFDRRGDLRRDLVLGVNAAAVRPRWDVDPLSAWVWLEPELPLPSPVVAPLASVELVSLLPGTSLPSSIIDRPLDGAGAAALFRRQRLAVSGRIGPFALRIGIGRRDRRSAGCRSVAISPTLAAARDCDGDRNRVRRRIDERGGLRRDRQRICGRDRAGAGDRRLHVDWIVRVCVSSAIVPPQPMRLSATAAPIATALAALSLAVIAAAIAATLASIWPP